MSGEGSPTSHYQAEPMDCSLQEMDHVPVVASITIRVSWGAPSIRWAATRLTLVSSSIRLPWVCRRPAVSTIRYSVPSRDTFSSTASRVVPVAGQRNSGGEEQIQAAIVARATRERR